LRNISKELQERLTDIESRRESIQKELDSLLAQENSLRVLLQAETQRWQPRMFPELAPVRSNVKAKGHTVLSKFILGSLGLGDKSLKVLGEEAKQANLLSGKKYPSRSLHFALVALKNAGLVDKTDGVWRLKHKEAVNVAGLPEDLRASDAPTQPA
jgi:hypothetical protein